jgi:protein O-GlcNAcase/histone acetyltransferase
VSRSITKEHIQRVSKVFRRKPLIWDNLHANDYDIKRIFLGPFCGRSTCLKNEISGLLLNPNTKYEANFVPFFTLGEWCQSDSDSPRVENGLVNTNNLYEIKNSDHNVTLESTPEEVLRAVEERHKPLKLYHPLTSLRRGLNEWLISLTHVPGPHVPPISEIETKTTIPIISDSSIPKTDSSIPPPTIRTCEGFK